MGRWPNRREGAEAEPPEAVSASEEGYQTTSVTCIICDMSTETSLLVIEGHRSSRGWHLTLKVDSTVESVCTEEELALLLERVACVASSSAASLRQRISAGSE